MSACPPLLVLAAMIGLAGCAGNHTPPRRTVSIDEVYRKRAGSIREGMTRREVYAVLPPARTPLAYPPQVTSIIGIAFYSYHREIHPIDADRCVEILYRLADCRDYPTSSLYPGKQIDLDRLMTETKPDTPVRSAQNRRDVVYRATKIFHTQTPPMTHNLAWLVQGSCLDVLLPGALKRYPTPRTPARRRFGNAPISP